MTNSCSVFSFPVNAADPVSEVGRPLGSTYLTPMFAMLVVRIQGK